MPPWRDSRPGPERDRTGRAGRPRALPPAPADRPRRDGHRVARPRRDPQPPGGRQGGRPPDSCARTAASSSPTSGSPVRRGDPALTRTGEIVGSPAYMSPERARGAPLGPPADLFSLGTTLYAAVEGRSPFQRADPLTTLHAIVTEDPPPADHAGPLAPLLAALLRKDPGARPAPGQVRAALEEAARTGSTATASRAAGAPAQTPPPAPTRTFAAPQAPVRAAPPAA